jgi:hypothetical protein
MAAWTNRAKVARAVGAGALSAAGLGGCQFFFPTPIEGHVERDKPAAAVRSVGASYLPGETLKVDVYLDAVLAGRGELKAGMPCKMRDRIVIPVSTSAESTGLARFIQTAKSETASLLDLETSFPVETRNDTTIGSERSLSEVVFDKARFDFRHQRFYDDGPKTQVDEIALPIEQGPHDGHSALGYLRNWRPRDGTRGYFYVVNGRYPWRAELTFQGADPIATERGEEKAVRIDGIATKLIGRSLMPSESAPPRPFSIWISDDDRRTPLRLLVETSVAKITVELTRYERKKPEGSAGDPPPCAALFDDKPLRAAVRERLDREKQREAAGQSGGPGYPSGSDGAKGHDDEKEERDALERVLNGAR